MNVFTGRSITGRGVDQSTAFSGISFTVIKQLFACPRGPFLSAFSFILQAQRPAGSGAHSAVQCSAMQCSAVLGTMHCSSAKPGLQNRGAETSFS